jgi:hypothetical protein
MSFKAAPPSKQIPLTKFGGLYTEGDPRSLPLGASPLCHDVDFLIAGVGLRPGLTTLLNLSPGQTALYVKSMELLSRMQTLVQDDAGNLLVEDLSLPGTLITLYSGILNAARALSETVNQREYITFSNFGVGSDQPRQYDGTNLDRISQVAPGLPPVVSFIQNTLYPILRITSAAGGPNQTIPFNPVAIWHVVWGAYMIDKTPPPGTSIYFLGAPGQTNFLGKLKVGDIVYISGSAMSSTVNSDGTYHVASVGTWASDKYGGVQQFFSVIADQIVGQGSLTAAQLGHPAGYYQQTLSVVVLQNPIPLEDAVVGKEFVISDCSVDGWDGVWQILDTPSEGQLLITATALAGNVATYSYVVVSGEGPAWQPSHFYTAGSQIVTPTGYVYVAYLGGISASTMPAGLSSGVVSVNDGGDTGVVWNRYGGAIDPIMKATVFNVNNGNGIFNIQGRNITNSTNDGTGGGTFTVALTSPDITTAAEEGSAVTGSGSTLVINPGLMTLNSGHPGLNPIHGNVAYGDVASSGFVTPGPESDLASGQRYAVCMFLTRNGFITPASQPIGFYTNGSSTKLTFQGLPIGPPNVIARVVALTAANSGIGGPYFYIPDDVILKSPTANLGAVETINKTVVQDNVSDSTGLIQIYDSVLLNSINVSVVGNNLQQQRELAECVKAVAYANRVFYQGERVKTDNFVNLTFDGGALSPTFNPTPPAGVPAGWKIESGTATLTASDIFGQSCVLNGTISQAAFQDALKAAIIQPNTKYSVRVTAKKSGGGPATLTVELADDALGHTWPFTPTVTSSSLVEFIGPFAAMNPLSFIPVPGDLLLRVIGSGVVIDRIEVFPTDTPAYGSQLAVSYAGNPEAIDSVTGILDVSEFTSQPITDHYRFGDELYIKTLSHTFSVQDDARSEPAEWQIHERSNAIGAFGPIAEDVGEEFTLEADLSGVYVYDGGNHMKITKEIQSLWDKLYFGAASVIPPNFPGANIWVRNDKAQQRILVGVPLPTPNAWLPLAPVNAAPATPNVILSCSYRGLAKGAEIGEADAVSVSQFTGHLMYRDRRRKWNVWQIATPFAGQILRADNARRWSLGRNGKGTIAYVDSTALSDEGDVIQERYQTFGFSEADIEQQLQIGSTRKIYPYATALVEGSGALKLMAYPETPQTIYPSVFPSFPLANPALDDQNIPLNETGNRLFLDFRNLATVGVSITAATNANPVRLTAANHGLQTGSKVRISGATGSWVPINSTFTVTVTGKDTFTIPVNSTTFGALTGSPVFDVVQGWFTLLRVVLCVQPDPRMGVSGR